MLPRTLSSRSSSLLFTHPINRIGESRNLRVRFGRQLPDGLEKKDGREFEPEASKARGMEASEGWRLPFLAKLPLRLPGCCCLVVTSLRSDALAKRGLGVLKIVRFSLHRALRESNKHTTITYTKKGGTWHSSANMQHSNQVSFPIWFQPRNPPSSLRERVI